MPFNPTAPNDAHTRLKGAMERRLKSKRDSAGSMLTKKAPRPYPGLKI